jgi:hypothetical protein
MRKKVEVHRPRRRTERPDRDSTRRKRSARLVRVAARTAPAPPVPAETDVLKVRCKGATRYGDPCRFWAQPSHEFCYWCEQAGRPRYPLPMPEAARVAATKESHKKRCQGVTVFGDQCRFWAVGATDYCQWCSGLQSPAQAKPIQPV